MVNKQKAKKAIKGKKMPLIKENIAKKGTEHKIAGITMPLSYTVLTFGIQHTVSDVPSKRLEDARQILIPWSNFSRRSVQRRHSRSNQEPEN